MIPLAYSLGFRYSMSLYVGLYLRQILYSWYEKVSRFKSPKNYTVRTGYFWEVENKLKVLLDKVFSKFLWNFRAFCLLVPKIKQPILIYDSQARIALGTKNGDLDAYYAKWRKEFESNKEEIVDVCSKLPDMNKYAINQEIGTKEVIKNISNELWFHERVFDIFLWSKG